MTKEILLNISLVKEAEGGYSAICNELDVASQGETIEEALANIKEAVELYLESAGEIGILEQVKEKLCPNQPGGISGVGGEYLSQHMCSGI